MRHTFLDVGSLSPQTEYARFENGRFVYRISRSPMCEYMINFIHKLKHLPEKYMMNSVLENFTILLVRITYCPARPTTASLSRQLQKPVSHYSNLWLGPSLSFILAFCWAPLAPANLKRGALTGA